LTGEVRRCRPLLGTYVEIAASGAAAGQLGDAVQGAFGEIERIERLMSAHDPDSELSRVNRDAARTGVSVSDDTFAVLERAHALAVESRGAFDYTVAPALARFGFLPARLALHSEGNYEDVRLLSGKRVRFARPLAIDLGGIAKGFAVDAAIDHLRGRGVASAIVNAGGDLRVYGGGATVVHLRHPSDPQSIGSSVSILDEALATSSPCFTEKARGDRRVSHLIDPRDGSARTGSISVSVRAAECWRADALTKVVLNAAAQLAETVLARHDAWAFVMSA